MLKNVNTYKQPEYIRRPLLAKILRSSHQVYKHHIQYTVYRETHIAKQRKSFFLCEATGKAKGRSRREKQSAKQTKHKQKTVCC